MWYDLLFLLIILKKIDDNIVKKDNKKKKDIQKVMAFQKDTIKDPLMDVPEHLHEHAKNIFRSLLKLSGNRNSRFKPSVHMNNVIAMALGNPN